MNWYGNDKYSTYGGNYPQFNCYGSQIYDSEVPPQNPQATDANNFFQISAGQQDIQHVQEHQQVNQGFAPKFKCFIEFCLLGVCQVRMLLPKKRFGQDKVCREIWLDQTNFICVVRMGPNIRQTDS